MAKCLHTCYYFTCTSTLFVFWIHCEYDMAANMCHMDNIGKSASPSIRLLKDHRQEVKSSYLKSWRALLSVNKTSCSHFFIFVLLFRWWAHKESSRKSNDKVSRPLILRKKEKLEICLDSLLLELAFSMYVQGAQK